MPQVGLEFTHRDRRRTGRDFESATFSVSLYSCSTLRPGDVIARGKVGLGEGQSHGWLLSTRARPRLAGAVAA